MRTGSVFLAAYPRLGGSCDSTIKLSRIALVCELSARSTVQDGTLAEIVDIKLQGFGNNLANLIFRVREGTNGALALTAVSAMHHLSSYYCSSV